MENAGRQCSRPGLSTLQGAFPRVSSLTMGRGVEAAGLCESALYLLKFFLVFGSTYA